MCNVLTALKLNFKTFKKNVKKSEGSGDFQFCFEVNKVRNFHSALFFFFYFPFSPASGTMAHAIMKTLLLFRVTNELTY